MAIALTSVLTTINGTCTVLLTASGGTGGTQNIDASTLAVASFDTANGASLAKLKASRLYRTLSRLYGTAAEAVAAARQFLVMVEPTGTTFDVLQVATTSVASGAYYLPRIQLIGAADGTYTAQINCAHSITR